MRSAGGGRVCAVRGCETSRILVLSRMEVMESLELALPEYRRDWEVMVEKGE